jgi:hypothetical protein
MNKDILYTSLFKDCLSKKIEELDLTVKSRFSPNKELDDFLNPLYLSKLDEYKSKNPLLKIDFKYTFFNRKLLPSTVVEVIFSNDFNELLGENILPNGLEKLIFGSNFNKVLNENLLSILVGKPRFPLPPHPVVFL